MVRVKNKPQHLVFCSHFPHQPFKHRHLPVETSNRPCPARVCCARFASNLEHLAGRSGASIPQFHSCLNPSPARTPAQDAEPVHSAAGLFKLWTFGPDRAAFASGFKARLGRKHPLMEHPGDTNPSGHNAIKHDMSLVFESAQAWIHGVAGTPDPGIPGENPQGIPKPGTVSKRLLSTPSGSGVLDDAAYIGARGIG
jgi:hypothetical protein